MNAWHERVLALQPQDMDLDASPVFGRIWEQLAGNILLANHTQPLWYWADENSVRFVEFWHSFDTDILFLLLYTPPQQVLMDAIEEGAETVEALQIVLEEWYRRTKVSLRFHLRSPARSVLLDSGSALSNTGAYLEKLTDRWRLPLTPVSTHTPRKAHDPLMLYLVDHFLQSHPPALALHDEVRSSLFQLPADEENAIWHPELSAALANCLDTRRMLLRRQAEHESLCQVYEISKTRLIDVELQTENQALLLTTLEADVERYQKNLSNTCSTLQRVNLDKASLEDGLRVLNQEKLNLIKANDALARSEAGLVATSDKLAIRATEQLTQIDKLSKENSHLTVDCQKLKRECKEQGKLEKNYQTQIENTEYENSLLLRQLHQTQEDLEQYFSTSQIIHQQMDAHRKRLQHVLDQHPKYWYYDSFEANLIESKSDRQIVQWHFIDVDVGKRLLPELSFKTVLVDGIAGIIIQRTEGLESPAPLIRWPSPSIDANELSCIPVKGSANRGNNAILSSLGPTDWNALRTLVKRLCTLLVYSADYRMPKEVDLVALRNGLLALDKTLANWPKLLRYDNIQLHKTLQIDGYHSLEIRLGNPQLGEQHWSDFIYRVATVFEPGSAFSQNPRLEFPESTRNVLESWFAESNDERGMRMELRFAQPNIMDIHVWNVLAANDRLLIAALLASTSTQLSELQHNNSKLSHSLQDWLTVGESMRRILAHVTTTNSLSQRV